MRLKHQIALTLTAWVVVGCAGSGGDAGGNSVTGVFFRTSRLVSDPVGGKLWASTPSSGGVHGNKIVQIDPLTGNILREIAVGSEPIDCALSSDGQTMWVSLFGQGAIQRVNLVSGVADPPISLGSTPDFGFIYPGKIQVLPGSPNSVVLERGNLDEAGVAVYDNGIARQAVAAQPLGLVLVRFATDAPDLYGFDDSGNYYRLTIDAGGVSAQQISAAINLSDFAVYQGKLFGSDGKIRDASTGAVLYTLNLGISVFAVLPVASRNRLYVLEDNRLDVFNLTTYALLQTIPTVSGGSEDLVAWGEHGVAFRDSRRVLFIDRTL